MGRFEFGSPKFPIGGFVRGVNNPELQYGVGIVFDLDLWTHGPPQWGYLVKFFNELTGRVEEQWFCESVLELDPDPMVLPEDSGPDVDLTGLPHDGYE